MTDSKPVDVGSIPTTVANIKRGYCTILLDKKSMGGTKTEQVFVIYKCNKYPERNSMNVTRWQSGHAVDCKSI